MYIHCIYYMHLNILTVSITFTNFWHKIQTEPYNSFSLCKIIYVITAYDFRTLL